MVNVGLVTGSRTPRAWAAPRTNVVLPAPSSPATSTTSPGWSSAARAAPSASVSAAEAVRCAPAALLGALTQAQAEADAGEQEAGTGERDEAGLGAGGRKLLTAASARAARGCAGLAGRRARERRRGAALATGPARPARATGSAGAAPRGLVAARTLAPEGIVVLVVAGALGHGDRREGECGGAGQQCNASARSDHGGTG